MDFWLTLYPDTFLWNKGDKGMVYNSANGESFEYYLTADLRMMVSNLYVPHNHYSVSVNNNQQTDCSIRQWIDKIVAIKAGEIRPGTEPRPVSFVPELKLPGEYRDGLRAYAEYYKKDLLENLSELTFYVNGSHKYGREKYRQFIYPIASDETVPFSHIKDFVYECRGGNISMINIVGDIFEISYLHDLLNWICEFHIPVTLHTTVSHLDKNRNKISTPKENNDSMRLTVVCDELSLAGKVAHATKNISAHWKFIVTSEADYDDAIAAIAASGVDGYEIVPFYTGRNMLFFENNVFCKYEEIVRTHLTKREIFAQQVLNTNFFGKLTILPDGQVYANVNHKPLGKLDDSLFEMLYKELSGNESWLKVRDSQPCSDCLCQYLCPSLSNYEIVSGRINMCDRKCAHNNTLPYE